MGADRSGRGNQQYTQDNEMRGNFGVIPI